MTNLKNFYDHNAERKRNFGRKLCDLRERCNMSVQRLSEETGFSRTTIHKWEAGEVYPKSADVFEILADYFKVPVSLFLQEPCCYSDLIRRIEVLEEKIKVVHNELLLGGLE